MYAFTQLLQLVCILFLAPTRFLIGTVDSVSACCQSPRRGRCSPTDSTHIARSQHIVALLHNPQVTYDDGLPGDLTTAHPSIAADGSLINFTRSLPFGGFHVYKQDPATLRRTQVLTKYDTTSLYRCLVMP
jgi:hypothetical protein